MQSLRQEYDLIIKPKVAINGRTPEPDLLFIKKNSDGSLNFDEPIYIDNKYHETTLFTTPQRAITDAVSHNSSADVIYTELNKRTLNGVLIPPNQLIKIKKVEKIAPTDGLDLVVRNVKP